MAIPDYDPSTIEKSLQDEWEKNKVWKTPDPKTPGFKKYYILDMFPYPSGRLHMGHVRNYTLSDVMARFRRMQGYSVLHPMGWDAFGLPAENAAIKNKLHPETWTLQNIATMKRQLIRLGIGYDWDREITTCLPEYYVWEQHFFLDLLEKGIAYKKNGTVNWCPTCQTVLANEQVEDGKCWRCESETTTKELEQWFLKTTMYAEELLAGLETLKGWPDRVKKMQEHWIGKSEGALIHFKLEDGNTLPIFTTRPDTLFGVSFIALAPEHRLALPLFAKKPQKETCQTFIQRIRKQDVIQRTSEAAPKEGVFTGSFAFHPITKDRIPIYLANFVLADYGTGALMGVPAHDIRDHAFATQYELPIKRVITSPPENQTLPFTGEGELVESGAFSGKKSTQARLAITEHLKQKGLGERKIQYKLRDWGLSRQRFWGAPIPVILCPDCGTQAVPRKELPIQLPKDITLSGEGESPLASHPYFKNATCPKCGRKDARRETDTMDTFMESSWYYLRYLSPHENQAPFRKEDLSTWLGIDQYIGGIEHATMHLLYFRFFHKVLRDLGYFPPTLKPQDRDEPARNLLNQGIVYKDGAKMSKSKGNVVEPDSIIEKYGADTARVFSMFAAPPEKIMEWSDQGVEGSFRFLNRVWRMVQNHESILKNVSPFVGEHRLITSDKSRTLRSKVHQTAKKVLSDFENGYHFNTSISSIMELVNAIYLFEMDLANPEDRSILREAIEYTVRLLYPFAPHLSESLWQHLDPTKKLLDASYPVIDPQALIKDSFTVVIQINGKLRSEIQVAPELSEASVLALAKEQPKVREYLDGKTVVKAIYVPQKLINFVIK